MTVVRSPAASALESVAIKTLVIPRTVTLGIRAMLRAATYRPLAAWSVELPSALSAHSPTLARS
jgi:hypothetical protein